jgi:hypothetical protein
MAATQARSEEWVYAKPFEDMPGPKPLPIIGNIWRFIPYIGKLLFRYVITGMLTESKTIHPFLHAIHHESDKREIYHWNSEYQNCHGY